MSVSCSHGPSYFYIILLPPAPVLHVANPLLLDLYWLYFGDFYDKDNYLHIIHIPQHTAIAALYKHFNRDCQVSTVYVFSSSFCYLAVFTLLSF